ncbi:MAG: hypothetical protein MUF05_00535 [Candidatus Omnitrophica bacterium]|jgi:hypothetical protein|nr:hypothetical protein [Candidatus Omnitrophota bacterium]
MMKREILSSLLVPAVSIILIWVILHIASKTKSGGEYLTEATARAGRRKSPWNLILIPFTVLGVWFSWVFQFKILWNIHILIFPEHAGKFSQFWRGKMSAESFISSFLLMVPLIFSSLALGMIVANLLAWCIPPARKVFNKEAQGTKEVSFRESMKALAKMAAYTVPICFGLGLIGAFTLKSFK